MPDEPGQGHRQSHDQHVDQENRETLALYPRKRRMAFWFVSVLVMLPIMVWGMRLPDTPVLIRLIIPFVIAMMAFGVVVFGGMLFSRKPAVVLSDEGILDNFVPLRSRRFIRWSDIEAVFAYSIEFRWGTQRYLGIRLKDRDKLPGRGAAMARMLRRLPGANKDVDIGFMEDMLGIPVTEVLTRISEKYPVRVIKHNEVR